MTRYASRFTLHASILILLLAALLRFYQLPDLPPGLNFDEAGNGVAALDILRGEPRLWWTIGGGKEPLWPYLAALSTLGLGNIPLALRLPAAMVGVLSVAAVYPLLRTLFRGQNGPLLALLTMLGLALSEWHLHFSRLGLRAILLPLLSTLSFYFFWRGLTAAKNRLALVLSALFMALAIYAYLAARLLPLALILFGLLQWLTNLRLSRTTPHASRVTPILSFITRHFLFLLIFLVPLIFHFSRYPAEFLARSTTVSIFNPEWRHDDLVGTVWTALTVTLGTFLGLSGDANPLTNLPGQPAVPLFLAPFFLLGLFASVYHAFKGRPVTLSPATQPPPSLPLPGRGARTSPPPAHATKPATSPNSPHLFLLCWWTVMLLPAILAPEGAPHHLRLLGAIVPTYAFIALGFVTLSRIINRITGYRLQVTGYRLQVTGDRLHPSRLRLLSVMGYLLIAAGYLLLGVQTYTNYFSRWPQSTDFTLPFDLYAARLAADMAQAGPETAYVLPMDIRAGAEARHYTLDYLLAGQSASYTYLPVDERNAETVLSQAARRHSELAVVRWTADKHHEADAKEIVTFLLQTQTQPLGRASFPVYDLERAAVLSGSEFVLPRIDRPVGADFEGLLRLEAAYLPPVATAGGWLPAALTVAPLAPLDADYKASLRLVSPAGELAAQKDRVLRHNFHQGTSLWPPETVNEYYLLPVPAAAPPGDYTVTVVLYHPETLAPLVAEGRAEVPLGVVEIR